MAFSFFGVLLITLILLIVLGIVVRMTLGD
jgi:hypothetical protein